MKDSRSFSIIRDIIPMCAREYFTNDAIIIPYRERIPCIGKLYGGTRETVPVNIYYLKCPYPDCCNNIGIIINCTRSTAPAAAVSCHTLFFTKNIMIDIFTRITIEISISTYLIILQRQIFPCKQYRL